MKFIRSSAKTIMKLRSTSLKDYRIPVHHVLVVVLNEERWRGRHKEARKRLSQLFSQPKVLEFDVCDASNRGHFDIRALSNEISWLSDVGVLLYRASDQVAFRTSATTQILLLSAPSLHFPSEARPRFKVISEDKTLASSYLCLAADRAPDLQFVCLQNRSTSSRESLVRFDALSLTAPIVSEAWQHKEVGCSLMLEVPVYALKTSKKLMMFVGALDSFLSASSQSTLQHPTLQHPPSSSTCIPTIVLALLDIQCSVEDEVIRAVAKNTLDVRFSVVHLRGCLPHENQQLRETSSSTTLLQSREAEMSIYIVSASSSALSYGADTRAVSSDRDQVSASGTSTSAATESDDHVIETLPGLARLLQQRAQREVWPQLLGPLLTRLHMLTLHGTSSSEDYGDPSAGGGPQGAWRGAAGCVITGKAGAGKTHFARAMARALHLRLLMPSVSTLVQSSVGGSERTLKEQFAEAKRLAPSLLVLDESAPLLSQQPSLVSTLAHCLDDVSSFNALARHSAVHVLLLWRTPSRTPLPPSLLRASRFAIVLDLDEEVKRMGVDRQDDFLRSVARRSLEHLGVDDEVSEEVLQRWSAASNRNTSNAASSFFAAPPPPPPQTAAEVVLEVKRLVRRSIKREDRESRSAKVV